MAGDGQPDVASHESAPFSRADLQSIVEVAASRFPGRRETTELVLLDVDPHRLHAYWTIDQHSLKDALNALGPAGPQGPMILRLEEIDSNGSVCESFDVPVHGLKNAWYIDVWRDGQAYRAALEYTGLAPGEPIAGTPIDEVFIGSCTESRIDDLRAAAEVVDGRRVSDNVSAWVIPGSLPIKRQAEAEGLDRIFTQAGFEWREPGCSKCVAMNGEHVAPGKRCVSNSNRNFIGRQGRDAITHLASTPMAAAAAIAGRIVDVRRMIAGEPV